MSEYAYTDISEAKRRVQEMKNKAREQTQPPKPDAPELLRRLSSPKDQALVLSVLYLLAQETADDALLSALLYIFL